MDNKLIYLEGTLYEILVIGLFVLLFLLLSYGYLFFSNHDLKRKFKAVQVDLDKKNASIKAWLNEVKKYENNKRENTILKENNKDLLFENEKLKGEIKDYSVKISNYKEQINELQTKIEGSQEDEAIKFAELIEKHKVSDNKKI